MKPRKSYREQMLNRLDRGKQWYTISNKAGDVAEIRLFDEIGFFGVTAAEFVAELDEITAPKITVAINSLGGSVFDGIAILNALRMHDAEITTRVDAMAASIAAVIVQAGDIRLIVTASQMMIHSAFALVIGDAADMRDMADLLDKQDKVIAGIFTDRTGRPADEIEALMAAETWFDHTEALEAGFVDQIVDPSSKPEPENRIKFTEQAESVLADLELLNTRTVEVVAFRSEQGKPPLSDDSVETFDRIALAHRKLMDAVASDEHDVHTEFARFIRSTQGV